MIRKNILLTCLILIASIPFSRALAGDVTWKNDFTFYGDNTEFFEPFRTGETLLGQQGKSFLQAALGTKAFLQVGVFADFRSQSALPPSMDVKPILSFQYREKGTRLIMGSLETRDRHGFLEPLEVSFLEFTRPIEYGFQWIEDDPSFKADLFLNWHQLNTPTQPESFDYGGTAAGILGDTFTLESQFHGFHDGGQQYYIIVINNWVGAAGFRWKLPGLLGETQFDGFGIASGYLSGGDTSQAQLGGGGYLRTMVRPDDRLSIFGTGWLGRDLYSQEGDANYASYSSPDSTTVDQLHGFVRHDRFYGELGAERAFPIEGDARFVVGFRLHFIDELTAYSYRLAVTAPFDIFLGSYNRKGTDGDGARD
jgi:hypothetical protein